MVMSPKKGLRPKEFTRPLLFGDMKGELTMEEVKNFIKNHKKEIILVASGVIIFNIGFRSGYKLSLKAIDRLVTDCVKTMDVTKF